jgi:4-amino-4-deoxy-L-arabinose transferase-like glycosyltransferase
MIDRSGRVGPPPTSETGMQESTTSMHDDAEGRARFVRLSIAITVLALLVRLFYLWFAKVDHPIRGDIFDYWYYAWNLVHHGTFSVAASGAAVPDSFRGPGYPAFLALCMAVTGSAGSALHVAQIAQILVGCGSVLLTIALARSWLGRPAALCAGLLVALWPHLIVFSSTLLSETFLGFSLLAMVLAIDVAQRSKRDAPMLLSGLAAGFAYLVNPVVLLYPIAIGALFAMRRRWRKSGFLLLGFFLVAGAWSLRNASLPPSQGAAQRAEINFVQGSWPLMHDAMNDQSINEIARAIVNQINEEEQLMLSDRRAGLESMWERISAEPGYYARWYFLQKPYLLWDWRVRIGWGDVYFLETHDSPFERNAALRVMHSIFQALNPYLFGLAAIGALFYMVRGLRRRADLPLAPVMVALFFVYITLIHAVLQAEPRYAVAYRPFEFLLAVSMLALAGQHLAKQRSAKGRRVNTDG